jgi:hypothetical protein
MEYGTLTIAGFYTLPDLDADGLPDLADATDDRGPDTDGDSIPDVTDTDDDNDGILDLNDPKPLDTDNDGINNAVDTDDDGDGILDTAEAAGKILDTDNDGTPNETDNDDDNDGVSDLTEQGLIVNGFYTLPDTDGDGLPDLVDKLDSDGDGISDIIDADADNDGINNTLESNGINPIADADNDGIPNYKDPTFAGFVDTDSDGINDKFDADLDGIANFLDLDSDNDGILDIYESLYYVAGIDPDNDGRIGTAGTPVADTNGDGIANIVDPTNATGLANISASTYFQDRDGDGLKNQFDIDTDNDGIVDNIEGQATSTFTLPTGNDTDKDGVDNAYDVNSGNASIGYVNTDGGSAPDYADTDSDNDGFKDLQENPLGISPGPYHAAEVDANLDGVLDFASFTDIDNDGLADIFDNVIGIAMATNVYNNQSAALMPNNQNGASPERDFREAADSDGDGVLDANDYDDDNDGIADSVEGTGDADKDGTPNYLDLDSDNDGIPDVIEAGGTDVDKDGYPGVASGGLFPPIDGNGLPLALLGVALNAPDTDGDGIKDFLDLDSDNDGISDVIEAGGVDSNGDGVYGTGITNDSDADGIIDAIDPFNNVTNLVRVGITGLTPANTDGTGKPDYLDLDSDGDGIPDNIEAQSTLGYVAPTGADSDGDGIDNAYDMTSGSAAIVPINTDASTGADYKDTDSDNDGILDVVEAGITLTGTDTDGDGLDNAKDITNGYADANGTYDNTQADNFIDVDGDVLIVGGNVDFRDNLVDTDGDGIDNNIDPDDDNDGILDTEDPKPLDTDNDGIDNVTDTDDDGDGILDTAELVGKVLDTDNDGSPNNLDADDDNDGVPDSIEQGTKDLVTGKYSLPDADGDGLPDLIDKLDSDGDGVPNIADTDDDNDGILDIIENAACNPAMLSCDTDKDGIPNTQDLDSDNDGITDLTEGTSLAQARTIDVNNDGIVDGATNPVNGIPIAAGTGLNPVDTDSDGLKNPYDLDSDNDGMSDLTEAGGTDTNLDGKADGTPNTITGIIGTPLTPMDTDGDGKANYCDIDADGDGINDVKENAATALLDTDFDGIIDGVDADHDGIIDTPETDTNVVGAPAAIFGGTFIAPDDTDGDGVPNYLQGPDTDGDNIPDTADSDDDNDGITDVMEGFTDNDGDGIPNNRDLDSDGDGLTDVTETNGTDANGDGRADGTPSATGIPTSAGTGVTALFLTSSAGNFDGDSKPDFLDLDSDNDGITDVIEVNGIDKDNNGRADGLVGTTGIAATAGAAGLTPVNTDLPAGQANDFKPDYRDLDSDDDGMPDVLEAGGIDAGRDGIADGIPNTDGMTVSVGLIPINTDNDSLGLIPIPDYRDIDSDNDGIKDTKENTLTAALDANNDGKIDGTDTDGDGIINNPAVDPNATYGGLYSQPTDTDNNGLANYKQPFGTQLAMKVMLQGALLNSTDGLMRDNLRTQNLIPLTSPYSVTLNARFTRVGEVVAPTTTTPAVLAANAGTANAIVDWVFVEVRDAVNATTVVKTVSALVQRDGDVVGADGLPLYVTMPLGNYFVAVKHRNHLGAMVANAVAFNGSLATLDFTSMTSAELYNNAGYNGSEMATVGVVKALWAGNCNGDNKVKYDGSSNDKSNILTGSISNVVNTSTIFNFNGAYGYVLGDINMDGKVKYDGSSNEKSTLLGIVLSHPLNAATPLFNYNFFLEQLP